MKFRNLVAQNLRIEDFSVRAKSPKIQFQLIVRAHVILQVAIRCVLFAFEYRASKIYALVKMLLATVGVPAMCFAFSS